MFEKNEPSEDSIADENTALKRWHSIYYEEIPLSIGIHRNRKYYYANNHSIMQ